MKSPFNFYSHFIACNWQWKLLLFTLLMFPVSPFLAAINLFILIIRNFQLNFKIIKKQDSTFLLLIIILWLIISSYFAYDKEDAFLGMANFLSGFIIFITFKLMVNKISHLKAISFAISFTSILIVILGLGQLYFDWSSSKNLSFLTGYHLVGSGIPPNRMSSLFNHANILSLYLDTSFILSLGLLLSQDIDKFNLIKVLNNPKKWKISKLDIWLYLTILLDIIGLLLTDSRNGWLIAFLAVIVFSFYYKIYPLLFLLTISGVFTAWASFGNLPAQNLMRKIVPDFIWLRLSDQIFENRPFPTLRITQWNFCLDMIMDKPILGWGIRSFSILYKKAFDTYLGHPHNLFLMFMAETGIIGLFLLMIFVGKILIKGPRITKYYQKNKSEGVIFLSYLICFSGYIIFNLFDVSIFDFRLNILGWFILACISGVSENIIEIKEEDSTIVKNS